MPTKLKTIASGVLVVMVVTLVFWAVVGRQLRSTTTTQIAAPHLVSPGNGSTLNDASITLQWEPIAGVSRYQVEIAYCNHASVCTDANTTTLGIFTSSVNTLVVTQLSAYLAINARWRVWAIDAQGKAGTRSRWWNFDAVHRG